MSAIYEKQEKEFSYQIYVTDRLMGIEACLYGVSGCNYHNDRFLDLLTKQPDTRTGEEIAADVIAKAGLVLKKQAP